MLAGQPIDIVPFWLVYPLTVILALLAAEFGYRLGVWWQKRTGQAADPALGTMVAASLGLLAFSVAFLTGIAADRFNTRRVLVLQEANAVGTAELRARYLPEPYSSESRALYREYVNVRLAAAVTGDVASARTRSEQIQAELWSRAVALVKDNYTASAYGLYIDALNHVIDVHGERVAAISARVPPTLLIGAYVVALLTMVLLGYSNSYQGKRSVIGVLIIVFLFAGVLTVIADLDRPGQGFLQVSQQPLIDLQTQLNH